MTQSWMNEHDNVSLELNDIRRERRDWKQTRWFLFAFEVLLNLVVMFVVAIGTIHFLEENSMVYAIIACLAWGFARLAVAIHTYGARIMRMEMHLVTIHDSVEWTLDTVQIVRNGKW
jgi:hypothetical protein